MELYAAFSIPLALAILAGSWAYIRRAVTQETAMPRSYTEDPAGQHTLTR